MTVETSYNASGTTTGTKKYQWDLRGRMTGYDADGNNSLADAGDVVHRYDPAGLRVSAITTTQTTRFVQDALNPSGYSQILEERNASNTPTRSYSVGLNQIAQAAGSTVNFYLNDAQQSVRTLTNTDGLPTDTYDYEAFGTVYITTGSTDNKYKFQGEYIDPITGLSDNRARWLRLGEGRFLSTDPTIFGAGDIGDANLHLYGGANPVFNSDPSGLFLGSLADQSASAGTSSNLQTLRSPMFYALLGVAASTALFVAAGVTFYYYYSSPNTTNSVDALLKAVDKIGLDVEVSIDVLIDGGFADPTYRRRYLGGIPVYFEPLDEYPHVAGNARDAIIQNPFRALLFYAGDGPVEADRRRHQAQAYAIKHQYDGQDPRTAKLNQLDEYPFASTLNGGQGARVVAAPGEENKSQGTDLQRFYRHENIDSPGEPFLVIPVPHRPFDY